MMKDYEGKIKRIFRSYEAFKIPSDMKAFVNYAGYDTVRSHLNLMRIIQII